MQTIILLLLLSSLELSPIPQSITLDGKDVFRLTPTTPVIVADDAGQDIRIGLRMLFEIIGYELPVYRASSFRAGDFGIYIGTAGDHGSFDHRRMRRRVQSNTLMSPESYRISIWRNGVVVAGADDAGTWYGLQTLLRIADQSPLQWPALEIRDYPDLPIRGALIQGVATSSQLETLAALKCNLVIFDSPDFSNLTDVRADVWQRVFAEARELHLEPVPILPVFNKAENFIRNVPHAVEARTQQEEVTLRSDDWVALREKNVLVSSSLPVQVTASGVLFMERFDYMLEYDQSSYPFHDHGRPFLIRRLPGGGIPDGATVQVIYSYAPPGSAGLCPNAPETEILLRSTVEQLVRLLSPRFLHVDLSTVNRIAQDLRCLSAAGDSPAGSAISSMLQLLDKLLSESNSNAQLMMWADLFLPATAEIYGVSPTSIDVPPRALIIAREIYVDELRHEERILLRRNLERLNKNFLLTPGNAATAAYGFGKLFEIEYPRYTGIVLPYTSDPFVIQVGMEKAWSRNRPVYVWPERMNAHLQAALWQPAYPERLQALITHYNRNSLRGMAPGAVHEGVLSALQISGNVVYDDPAEADQIRQLSLNISNYLSLESEFQRSGDQSLLRRLVDVVKTQTQVDPAMDIDRQDRILQNVEGQGLFVPASILFGEQLLYYRRQNLPAGRQVLEIPVRPEFHDTPGRVNATIDLLSPVAPIARIDYESVGARNIVLEVGESRNNFQVLQQWNSDASGMVRSPLLLDRTHRSRLLQLQVESSVEQAVLRELRVFGVKEPATLAVPITTDFAVRRTPNISEIIWSNLPQVTGFVVSDAERFAEAPTEVRVIWNRSYLLVRIDAFEPRMNTVVSDFVERDAPLWEQESVEIVLLPNPENRYRFVTNPMGTRYDSHNGDSGWRGSWSVQTQPTELGWRAYIAIPFADLHDQPERGATWSANFIRNRHNVIREKSVWAWEEGSQSRLAMGELRFE